MHVLVTGATGYIGGRLVPRLIASGHAVRCLTRSPKRLAGRFAGADVVAGDARDAGKHPAAFAGIDVAYYLIHSLGTRGADFETRDREMARNFAIAAKAGGVKRVIYLGGLGDATHGLSKHLRSRHEVGDILREFGPPVTEFRAAIVIGSGSVSFEMVRYLAERLPVMIAPKWVATRSQPIAVGDVLKYLVSALDLERTAGRTYDIGGLDIVSYRDLMLRYARVRSLRRMIIQVPFFTPRLSSYWIHIVTPVPSGIARPLIDGLRSEMIVQSDAALADFPIRPIGCDEAIRRALDRYTGVDRQTTWFDAFEGRDALGEFRGIVQGMLVDRCERSTTASAHAVFNVVTSLGGVRGWLYADWLWALRGAMDWAFGGTGMRRGRRSPTSLRMGDAVDFWRVEALEPDRLLRLRAEMKLPGDAWLEFAVVSDVAGSKLRLTAFFEPKGLFGQAYWYLIAPLHSAIFNGLADRIVAQAAALGDDVSERSARALTAISS